jgi:hypothetical protein
MYDRLKQILDQEMNHQLVTVFLLHLVNFRVTNFSKQTCNIRKYYRNQNKCLQTSNFNFFVIMMSNLASKFKLRQIIFCEPKIFFVIFGEYNFT